MVRSTTTLALLGILALAAPAVRAQQPAPVDSAAILHDAARRLEADGQRAAADAVYQMILRRYPTSAAAALIAEQLAARGEPLEAGGRFRFVGWSTVYGAWLGLAIPAALGAEGTEVYGAGLLLGGPAGLLGSLAYARAQRPTRGQADAMVFGSQWGTWQGIGWKEALDLGQTCDSSGFCFSDDDARHTFQAMVIGGLSGLAGGIIAGRRYLPTDGQVSFASNAALWGSWFGLAGSIMAGVDEGDDALLVTLLTGNAGLVAGALAAPRDVTASRVWLTTAVGVAGAAAGLGIDLIVDPDDATAAMVAPTVLSAAGLLWGWKLTAPVDARRGRRASLDLPVLEPGSMVLGADARGRRVQRPALTLRMHAEF